MRLDHLLARVGASIVTTEKGADFVVLMIRVSPQYAAYWQETLNEFLLASAEKHVAWTTDVSKKFFPVPDAGVVRYLWRVVLSKDPRAAAEALGRSALRALAESVEVKSQPLVGRKEYVLDIPNGKTAGPHPLDQSGKILAQGMRR